MDKNGIRKSANGQIRKRQSWILYRIETNDCGMKIIGIRYNSTNCYFIDTGNGLLAFDAGWPGTFVLYRDQLKREGYHPKDIRWLIVSHFHMDHAGLAGLLVRHGVQFIVFTNQLGAIAGMEALIARKDPSYVAIDMERIVPMELGRSRAWLASTGIKGEVIQTNGHGEQSVTLLLDTGEAFIGDLPPENALGENDVNARNNWKELRSKGAVKIYPAHAEITG